MIKILLIEDNEVMRETLKELLERNSYEVLAASDGEEGTKLYNKFLPDLVITDLIMPNKGGLRTIVDLKQQTPSLKIIAISGGGTLEAEQYLNASKFLKADKTLKKPFSNEQLLERIKELIG
ncbi:MAG: response regulator [Candidatus Omnitrophica bacterium]|nr:response regulator [Candidatus Omnitrophota bacterium]MBU1995645.1 response regulator [Candidatus Omnitrophota bacterium]